MAEGGESFGGELTKDIHGVPVWAIGTGVGVLFAVLYWLWKREQSSGVTATTYDPSTDTATDSTDSADTSTPYNDYLADNVTSTANPVGSTDLPTPLTNGQWAKQVIVGLLSKGDDPTLVNNAITKYLNGSALTAAEEAVVNEAITIYGSLPEGAKTIVGGGDIVKTAPTGLKVTKTLTTSANLDWNPLTGVQGYRLFVNGKQNGVAVVFSAGTVSGLKSKTSYNVQVCGVYANVNGPLSAAVTVKTK